MKLVRCSEAMNPCSVSTVYKCYERFRNGRKSTEDGFEEWSALRCENDYEGHHFLTRLAKMLTKHDVMEKQSSNFKEMRSGHYVSIQSFREVFTVSQTTLVMLIVITNC